MSNEELAARVKAGDTAAAAQLWAQGEMDRAMSAYSH